MLLKSLVSLIGSAAIFFVFLGVLQEWDMHPVAKGIFAALFSAGFSYIIFRESTPGA